MTLSIYHNPRCSKSRQTLELLRANGLQPQVIEYLTDPPAATTLDDILAALDIDPITIMRTGETTFEDARDEVMAMNRAEQLDWLAANIRVLQRPIVVNGDQARIGRPPESVLEILD